jgi:arylsulfatase A-like enzyme
MKTTIICLVSFAVWPITQFAWGAEPDKPDVLLIAVDDLNDWVGFLKGHPQVKTPHLDRLARRGIVFANAHCPSPLCCPSRTAVFTGQQPFRTGVYNNDQNIRKLRPDTITLPQVFARGGYRTLGTGKLLHHGSTDVFDEYFGTEQRWSPFAAAGDVAYSARDQARKGIEPRYTVRLGSREIVLPLNGMPNERNPDSRNGESFDWGPFDVDDDQMGGARITQWAIDQLRRGSEQPRFLAVGYYRPHIPLWAPRKYFDLYPIQSTRLPDVLASDLDDLSPVGRRWALEPVTAGSHKSVLGYEQWRAAVAAYRACVSFVDAQIGRLLDALDASPRAENTVVVVFGDHGWHLGEKQHWGKWTGWERSTRVPLLVVPPRRSSAAYRAEGAVCSQPVGLIDLYPTLLELCGLPGRGDLDGRSLVASLREPASPREPVVTTFDYGNYSVRDARWRFIRYQDGSEEMYDHDVDSHEWHNLAGDARHNGVRSRLAAQIPSSPAAPLRAD